MHGMSGDCGPDLEQSTGHPQGHASTLLSATLELPSLALSQG